MPPDPLGACDYHTSVLMSTPNNFTLIPIARGYSFGLLSSRRQRRQTEAQQMVDS